MNENRNVTEAAVEGPVLPVSEKAVLLPRIAPNAIADSIAHLRAQGKAVLTLCGAPYWRPPEHVLSAAKEAADRNENAPSAGFLELREAISNSLEGTGISTDPKSQIVVTNGAMHALSVVFNTLLNPNEEVVLFRPSFFFFGTIRLAGGVAVYADTFQDQGWRWDTAALESVITPRTRIIVLNSPMNPTGYVPSEEDLLAVAQVACRHGLLVVSDECYDNMVYDDARHIRVASVPGLENRTITVCSFTKTLAMQPWRIGFIAAPARLAEPFRNTLEWTTLRCSHVAQRAAQAALSGPRDWLAEISRRFQRGRDIAAAELKSARNLSFAMPRAAPFLFLNAAGTGASGAAFSQLALHSYGVPTDDGAFFGSASHVRFAFGAEDDVVRTAAKRLVEASAGQIRT